MIYEKRTYTINPLKMADWLALYQSDALGGANRPSRPANRLLFTEIGVVNQVVHIWAYESLGRSSGAPRADGPGRTLADLLAQKSRTGRRGTPRVGADAPHRFFTSAVRSPT